MAIQLLNGSLLIRSGDIATSSDCCCTPSCLPDACVSPSVTNCRYCWDSSCNGGSCLEWQTIEVAIDGVGDTVSIPSDVPDTSFCRDDWNCNCDVFNSSFIHDFSGGACSSNWTVREVSPPYLTYDVCNTNSGLFACNSWRIARTVFVRVAVANQQVSYTTGAKTSVAFPNYTTITSPGTNGLIICNNYTLQPGHYVIIRMTMTGAQGLATPQFYDSKWFIYGFGNGVKVDPACADDQYYPTCSVSTGGTATLLMSSRYTRAGSAPSFPAVYDSDCGSYDVLCDLSSATVTVEPPLISVCPPPPI